MIRSMVSTNACCRYLRGSAGLASRIFMRGLLALIFVFMLMISHGTVGWAAPHADHHDEHGATAVDDHLQTSPSEPAETAPEAGHVTHVHVSVTLIEPRAINTAAPVVTKLALRPPVVSEPTSRSVPPLLEPPSA